MINSSRVIIHFTLSCFWFAKVHPPLSILLFNHLPLFLLPRDPLLFFEIIPREIFFSVIVLVILLIVGFILEPDDSAFHSDKNLLSDK
jgi:hypothetical protein